VWRRQNRARRRWHYSHFEKPVAPKGCVCAVGFVHRIIAPLQSSSPSYVWTGINPGIMGTVTPAALASSTKRSSSPESYTNCVMMKSGTCSALGPQVL